MSLQSRDDSSLLLSSRFEEVVPEVASATNSRPPTIITAHDPETDSQGVPCWRGAKACFCTLRRYLLVAICDILIITVLCVTLVEPRWLAIRQGQCRINGREGRYIGVDFFFSRGLYAESPQQVVFRYGDSIEMINCLNAVAVTILRCAVTLIICCICLTLVSFFFCIVKLRVQLFMIIRKYAVFNIVTAIICSAILILIFCASDEVNTIQQRPIRIHTTSNGDTASAFSSFAAGDQYISQDPYAITDFSTGYYLVLLAAFLSLLAVGITLIDCSCYHQVFTSSRHSRGYERLVASSATMPTDSAAHGSSIPNRQRSIFAVAMNSHSTRRTSRSTGAIVSLPDHAPHAPHLSSSTGLLPPPPPYSASIAPRTSSSLANTSVEANAATQNS